MILKYFKTRFCLKKGVFGSYSIGFFNDSAELHEASFLLFGHFGGFLGGFWDVFGVVFPGLHLGFPNDLAQLNQSVFLLCLQWRNLSINLSG